MSVFRLPPRCKQGLCLSGILTQRRLIVSYRHSGITYWSWRALALTIGPIGCPETSVINYHTTLRNIPEEDHIRQQYFISWHIQFYQKYDIFSLYERHLCLKNWSSLRTDLRLTRSQSRTELSITPPEHIHHQYLYSSDPSINNTHDTAIRTATINERVYSTINSTNL
jgi:hypothetical protein